MAKELTAAEVALSKAFLHDLFVAGGLVKYPIRTLGDNYVARYCTEEAKVICKEIKYRTFDFLSTDYAISTIAGSCWVYPLNEPGKAKRPDKHSIANIIAAFCAENEILWDNVNVPRTVTEMETFRKSLLGNACWQFGCFLSQTSEKAAATTSKTTKSTKAGATRGSAPKSDYKVSGAKSGLIKGLIGKPGEKTTFARGKYLYSVLCSSTKTKPQFAFIDPVSTLSDPNVVRLGDPSGYTACKLFFTSVDEANAAIEKIKSSIIIPDHISGFSPARASADANGYFLVRTEIGPAYIKARKLNETIAEELEETEDNSARKAKFPEINDVDTYTEAFFRE
jgi:hypothetical protein